MVGLLQLLVGGILVEVVVLLVGAELVAHLVNATHLLLPSHFPSLPLLSRLRQLAGSAEPAGLAKLSKLAKLANFTLAPADPLAFASSPSLTAPSRLPGLPGFPWPHPVWGLNLVLASLFLLALSHDYMVRSLVELCNALSREKAPVRPALNPARTMLALVLHCALMPILAGSVLCMRKIRWGAVMYTKEGGRVSQVQRINPDAGEESSRESLSTFLRTGRGIPDQRELRAVVKQIEVEKEARAGAGRDSRGTCSAETILE